MTTQKKTNMQNRILHLTLKKKWFDLIKSGEKKTEYREIKPYWIRRFYDGMKTRRFDYIIFRNGYSKNSPRIKVEWKDIGYGEFEGRDCFAIKLGKVLDSQFTQEVQDK